MKFQSYFFKRTPSARDALVEKMPDGILVLNNEGCIADVNPAAEMLLGFNKSSLIGKPLDQISPELKQISRNLGTRTKFEISLERSDKPMYYEVNITGLTDKHGASRGNLIMFHNITETKMNQIKLESSFNEELQLRLKLQDEVEKRIQYTRGIIHELNTPLTAILSSSELLEEMSLEKMPSSLVQNIRRASLNLEQRTSELTKLTRGSTFSFMIPLAKTEITATPAPEANHSPVLH